MLSPQQRQQFASILGAANDLAIATVRPDGWPQVTTVSYVSDGTRIYFGTWSKSQKALNIDADPRVSVTVTAPYQSWDSIRGVSFAAHARRVLETAELDRVFQLMIGKFPQIAQFVKTGENAEMAIFSLDPEIVSILDYSQGFGHTEEAAA